MKLLVVFGAFVKPDGEPSGALRRRVEGALNAARKSPRSMFLLTGTPSETSLMKELLKAEDILDDRVIEDADSRDTLSSVLRCSRIIHDRPPFDSIVVCTDRYHVPRCRWLFHLLGVRTQPGVVPSGLRQNGVAKWSYFYAREAAALIVDTFLVWGRT
jgi:uncharacterized SAM-binding protein YcdF (DUF218 family)